MIYIQSKAYQEFGREWKRWYDAEICFCVSCNIVFDEESIDRKNWKKPNICPVCNKGKLFKKIVPRDFKLTPIALAYWLMGDGSSGKTPYDKNHRTYYSLLLCTDGFLKTDVMFLKKLFRRKYHYHFKVNRCRGQFRLKLNNRDEVRDFLLKTSFYKLNCFDYKWEALNNPSHVTDRKYWNKNMETLIKKWYPTEGSNIPKLLN